MVKEFEREAADARVWLERLTKGMCDRCLMASALRNEWDQITFEASMMLSYHAEARELARQVIALRRKNVAMIEQQSANSEQGVARRSTFDKRGRGT